MSRTLDPILQNALATQQGEVIIRVKTWANLAAYNSAPTAGTTWDCTSFEINNTSANAEIITPDNSYSAAAFDVFLIVRGATVAGVDYTEESGLYFVKSYTETPGKIQLKGSSYPNTAITLAGDGTYQSVITAFCTAIGKTATFADPTAAFLAYQFLPDGKQVILNKAERFENLLRQKYTIGVYERSPKELVFYAPIKSVSDWTDIIYADGKLILVADAGTHKTASSTDGLSWQKNSAPNFSNAVCYSETLDLFVAVGNSTCQTSPDGITWTSRTIPPGTYTDVAWHEASGKFLAIDNTGLIQKSTDGINWTTINSFVAQTPSEDNQWNCVCYAPSLGMFAAVSQNGTNRVMTSYDGETWTARTAAAANQWHSICWSEDLSIFVAVALDGAPTRAMTSTDGITWTSRTTPDGAWRSVCWSPDLSLFVAVSDSNVYVMTSPDGITWTQRTASAYQWYSVTWSPAQSLFCAVAYNGTNRAMTSPDGITWTNRTIPASGWLSVCWSDTLNLFCAIAYSGTVRIATSPDGITWTNRTSPATYDWRSIIYITELNLFLAVSGTNAINSAMTSADGITWALRTTPTGAWYSVTWAADQGKAVAVAYSGTNSVMLSDNPAAYSPPAGATKLAAPVNSSTIVAAGFANTYTSTDGDVWTLRSATAGTRNVATNGSDTSARFVQVGINFCRTSPDGITWTSRTIPAGTYNDVTWSEDLSLWLAVGTKLATSPDGITWTARTAPNSNTWTTVTANPENLSVIIASDNGDYRLAISYDAINWTAIADSADYSLDFEDGTNFVITRGLYNVHYLWRDEAGTTHTLGDTDEPAWNLGYLESTASPPSEYTDPYYKFTLRAAPVRLDITDGDRIHFVPLWTLDPSKSIDTPVLITEHFSTRNNPMWTQEIRSIALFEHTEGGALPSTIERVAAYTPLVSSGFDGNLSPEINNLQALAQAVDDLALDVGSVDWGFITGTLSNQGDLQVALNSKADQSEVTTLSNLVDTLPTNPLSADLDFAGFKAIALACDSGSTLPAAPNDGQWFLHTPAGRSVLMQYVGGAWKALQGFGDVTVYVDGTLGTDAQDKGFGTGADAFLTPQYALDQCPKAVQNGDIIIYVAAGTYDVSTLGLSITDFLVPVYFYGEYATLDSGTITSSTAGSRATGTRATMTDTSKAWTTDQWFKKFMTVTYLGVEYALPIRSNTADTLTVSSQFSTNFTPPTGTYKIIEPTTIFTGTVTPPGSRLVFVNYKQIVTFTCISFNLPVAANSLFGSGIGADIIFEGCVIERDRQALSFFSARNTITINRSVINQYGSGGFNLGASTAVVPNYCIFDCTTPSYAIVVSTGSTIGTQGGNTFIGYSTTIQVINGAIANISMSGNNGFNTFEDCQYAWDISNSLISVASSFYVNTIPFRYSNTQGETTISRYDAGDSPALTVKQRALLQNLTAQTAAIGTINTDVQGDGRRIYNVPHTTEGMTSPANPSFGDIWIDTN